MLLTQENSFKNNLIGLSMGPINTQVTDITDYPCSPALAINAGFVAICISWVPLQCDLLLLWALLPQNPMAPQRAPAPELKSKCWSRWLHNVWLSSLTLVIRMMSAAYSTQGSSWEIIKCMNTTDAARSSVSRKAHYTFDLWCEFLKFISVTMAHSRVICLKPWCFSMASVTQNFFAQLNPESIPPCEMLRAVRSLWEVISPRKQATAKHFFLIRWPIKMFPFQISFDEDILDWNQVKCSISHRRCPLLDSIGY